MNAVKYILYVLIISFFSYTLMNKVLIYDAFLLNISKTGLFNDFQIYALSVSAIAFEAIAVLLLVLKKRIGLIFSICMMLVFTVYIIFLYVIGRYEVCGCGGIMNGLTFESHFLVNAFIILVMMYLLKEKDEKE